MEWIFEDVEEKYFEDVPIIKRVDTFLAHIDKKGLKLTQKGNLPTKVVKDIVLINNLQIEKDFRRFFEVEFPLATFVKDLVIKAGLLRKQHNKYFLTKKGEKYVHFSKKEKYLLLLDTLLHKIKFENFYSQISASLFFAAVDFFKKSEKRFYDESFLIEQFLPYNQELYMLYQKMIENDMPTHYIKIYFRITLLDFMMYEFGLVQKRENNFVKEYQRSLLLEQTKDFTLKESQLLNEEMITQLSKEIPDITLKFFAYVTASILEEDVKIDTQEDEEFYDALYVTLDMLYNVEETDLREEITTSIADGLYKSIDKKDIVKLTQNIKAIDNYIQKCYKEVSKNIKKQDKELNEMFCFYKTLLKYLMKIKKIRKKEQEMLKDYIKLSTFLALYMLAI